MFVFVDSLQFGDRPDWDGLLEAFPVRYHEPYYRHYLVDHLDGLFAGHGLQVARRGDRSSVHLALELAHPRHRGEVEVPDRFPVDADVAVADDAAPGDASPDEGIVRFGRGVRIASLDQDPRLPPGTVAEQSAFHTASTKPST